ncbi:MAG: hypothetical protein ACMV0F_01685 [Trichlorobacter sp.]|jgi:hypothetical protein
MQDSINLVLLIIAAFAVSIPCGYIRESFRKFSIPWLLMAHLPIPLVVHMRHLAGFGWKFIPFTLLAAIGGQVIGARFRRARNRYAQPSEK